MPVFQRVKIERFKEILLNQPAGLVSDGGFSTYTIDDPLITPIGTGDFLGVIKTAVLLAEVYEDTMDTRNMSFAQFNNLTQQQFDDAVRQGTILLNRNNNFQSRRIGWVEIGRTRASFYYETCDNSSKRPVSEHYYDLSQIQFDNKIVLGEGSEVEPTVALSQIGNFDPNWTNNTGIFGPGFNPIPLSEYVKFAAFNNGMIQNVMGDTRQINPLGLTDDSRPIRVNLLMATRTDHFDNQYATEITPGKWGMIRSTIEEGFRPGIHVVYDQLGLGVNQQQSSTIDFSVNVGGCLALGYTITTGGGTVRTGGRTTTTTPETGGPTPPPDGISDSDININDIVKRIREGKNDLSNFSDEIDKSTYDSTLKVNRDFYTEPCVKFIHDFPLTLRKKLKLIGQPIDIGELNESFIQNYDTEVGDVLGFGWASARAAHLFYDLLYGRIPYSYSDIPDILDTPTIPRGTIRKEINPNDGCIELTYMGTPCRDYIGPKIATPADIDFERGDEPGFDEPELLDIFLNMGYSRTINQKDWFKRIYTIGPGKFGKWGGGYIGGDSMSGEATQPATIWHNENERLYPVYFHASDQQWVNGKAETRTIRLSNRGWSRLIITDYTPRGNANFVNIGLLNALPLVLNPGEYVDVDIDYNPLREGLQSWKGESDPFTALLTDIYPLPYIRVDFEVWCRVRGIGYIRLDELKATPGVGPFKWKLPGAYAEDRLPDPKYQRMATALEIKKRNKAYSILSVAVPQGT